MPSKLHPVAVRGEQGSSQTSNVRIDMRYSVTMDFHCAGVIQVPIQGDTTLAATQVNRNLLVADVMAVLHRIQHCLKLYDSTGGQPTAEGPLIALGLLRARHTDSAPATRTSTPIAACQWQWDVMHTPPVRCRSRQL